MQMKNKDIRLFFSSSTTKLTYPFGSDVRVCAAIERNEAIQWPSLRTLDCLVPGYEVSVDWPCRSFCSPHKPIRISTAVNPTASQERIESNRVGTCTNADPNKWAEGFDKGTI